MKGKLDRGFGYQGDKMNLPVADVDKAIAFYETVLGFSVLSRSEQPEKSAVLVRDEVEMRLAENGGDPSQDGCAFHVTRLEALLDEFKSNGLQKELSDIGVESHGESSFRVFYVVAPDGLCYWFGERQET
jgi:catechol 2,3-dioxygenase-like lactoylglutathione lyase family enzyme